MRHAPLLPPPETQQLISTRNLISQKITTSMHVSKYSLKARKYSKYFISQGKINFRARRHTKSFVYTSKYSISHSSRVTLPFSLRNALFHVLVEFSRMQITLPIFIYVYVFLRQNPTHSCTYTRTNISPSYSYVRVCIAQKNM